MKLITVIVHTVLPGCKARWVACVVQQLWKHAAKEGRSEGRAALSHWDCAERLKVLYGCLRHIPRGAAQAGEHSLRKSSSLHVKQAVLLQTFWILSYEHQYLLLPMRLNHIVHAISIRSF